MANALPNITYPGMETVARIVSPEVWSYLLERFREDVDDRDDLGTARFLAALGFWSFWEVWAMQEGG